MKDFPRATSSAGDVELANSDERIKAVIDFQSLMFKSDGLLTSEEIDEVLHELAGDLEFYVSGDSQDPSYFGDAKAQKLIGEALARIETLGLN